MKNKVYDKCEIKDYIYTDTAAIIQNLYRISLNYGANITINTNNRANDLDIKFQGMKLLQDISLKDLGAISSAQKSLNNTRDLLKTNIKIRIAYEDIFKQIPAKINIRISKNKNISNKYIYNSSDKSLFCFNGYYQIVKECFEELNTATDVFKNINDMIDKGEV